MATKKTKGKSEETRLKGRVTSLEKAQKHLVEEQTAAEKVRTNLTERLSEVETVQNAEFDRQGKADEERKDILKQLKTSQIDYLRKLKVAATGQKDGNPTPEALEAQEKLKPYVAFHSSLLKSDSVFIKLRESTKSVREHTNALTKRVNALYTGELKSFLDGLDQDSLDYFAERISERIYPQLAEQYIKDGQTILKNWGLVPSTIPGLIKQMKETQDMCVDTRKRLTNDTTKYEQTRTDAEEERERLKIERASLETRQKELEKIATDAHQTLGEMKGVGSSIREDLETATKDVAEEARDYFDGKAREIENYPKRAEEAAQEVAKAKEEVDTILGRINSIPGRTFVKSGWPLSLGISAAMLAGVYITEAVVMMPTYIETEIDWDKNGQNDTAYFREPFGLKFLRSSTPYDIEYDNGEHLKERLKRIGEQHSRKEAQRIKRTLRDYNRRRK